MQRCWFPQTLPTRQPSRCMSAVLNSRLKLPDILSCQAEASRLALTTTLIVRFKDFLVHKSLFTKGFWLAAAEKLYDGATAETANVVRALAMHNSTYWKRGVHSDGQNRIIVNRGHARTHEIPWREWQVDTNQISTILLHTIQWYNPRCQPEIGHIYEWIKTNCFVVVA